MIIVFRKMMPLFVVLSLLSACSTTPQTHFYVLEARSVPAAINNSQKKTVIGIGPLTVPAMLERKQIITRSDQHGVQIAEFHQWAAPLQDNIAQVLAQNLAAIQTHQVIRAYPWSAYGKVDYRIVVEFDRFDTSPGASVNLEARWSVINENTQRVIANNHTVIEHPLIDRSYPLAVKALSEALEEFGQQLSSAIDRLK